MSAPAPPLEAVGPPPKNLSGPPEAGPPKNGNSFHGALEDSMARTADAEGHQGEGSAKAPGATHQHRGKPRHPHVAAGNDVAGGEAPAASAPHKAPATSVGGVTPLVGAALTTTAGKLATVTATAPRPDSQTTTSAALGTDSSSAKSATADPATNAIAYSAAVDHRDPAAVSHDPAAGPHDPAAKTNSLPGNTLRSIVDDRGAPEDSPSTRLTSLGGSQSGSSTGTATTGAGTITAGVARSSARLTQLSTATSSLLRADDATASTTGERGTGMGQRITGMDPGMTGTGRGMTGKGEDITRPAPSTTVSSAAAPGTTEPRTTEPSATGSSTTAAALSTRPTAPAQNPLFTHHHRSDRIGFASTSGHATDRAAADATAPVTGSATVTDSAAAANVGPSGLASTAGASGLPPLAGGESPTLAYASGMRETIETINATVALANRVGAAHATIRLEPAELGTVRIHLSQTSEGLIARVSAETAAGAQAIASGHSELHSTLSSLGVSLLRLDIGAFSHQEGRAGGHAQQPAGPPHRNAPASETDLEELHAATLPTTLALSSSSALIDVLA